MIGLYRLDEFPQNWFSSSPDESALVVEMVDIYIQFFTIILYFYCISAGH